VDAAENPAAAETVEEIKSILLNNAERILLYNSAERQADTNLGLPFRIFYRKKSAKSILHP
jgi:hypothetical protein